MVEAGSGGGPRLLRPTAKSSLDHQHDVAVTHQTSPMKVDAPDFHPMSSSMKFVKAGDIQE